MITNNGEGTRAQQPAPQVQHRSRGRDNLSMPKSTILVLSPPIKTRYHWVYHRRRILSQSVCDFMLDPSRDVLALTKAMMIVYRDNGPARIGKVPDDASDQWGIESFGQKSKTTRASAAAEKR